MAITHSKVSAIADVANTALVRPSDWNASHGGDISRSASQIVAANDALASSKNGADLLCDAVDDDVQIQAAIDAVATLGGSVYLSEGTFLVSTSIKMKSNVMLIGAGIGATIVKLKNSAAANTNVIESQNFAAMTGTNNAGGDIDMFLDRFTIDGNKANNATGGWGFRKYGYRNHIGELVVRNCKAGGIWTEWADGASAPVGGMEDQWSTVRIYGCDGPGLQCRGPHDSVVMNIIIHDCLGGARFEFLAATYSGSNWILRTAHTWRNGSALKGIELIGSELECGDLQVEGHTGVGGVGLFVDSQSVVRVSKIRAFLNETGVELRGGTSMVHGYWNDNASGIKLGVGGTASFRNKITGFFRDNSGKAINLVNSVGDSIDASVRTEDVSGTANAAVTTTNTTLTDTRTPVAASRLPWRTNQWIDCVVTCNGKTMTVTSNTANTLTGVSWSGGGNPGNGFAWSLAQIALFGFVHDDTYLGDMSNTLRGPGTNALTENKGSATVASGGTTIVVTHGLIQQPNISDIFVTPTNNMGNAGSYFVSAVGATTFTINTDIDPGATTATFSWRAECHRVN